MRPIAAVVADRRLILWALAWTAVALVGLGVTSAIVPNPVFGRSVPPEPFAIVVWLATAPLVGLLAATYVVPTHTAGRAVPLGTTLTPAAAVGTPPATGVPPSGAPAGPSDGSLLGTLAALGAFLAIGCPLCNKVVLVVLGASGAMSVWAPIQPVVGVSSVLLLAGTVAWRLRRRAAGDVCAVPARWTPGS